MDRPEMPSVGIEAIFFLAFILWPYYAVSLAIQYLAFYHYTTPYERPGFFEIIIAHALSFVVSVVLVMLFMHYFGFFELLFLCIPLVNIAIEIFFYHTPYRTFKKVNWIVVVSNLAGAVVSALYVYYCFDWIMNSIF